MLKIDEGGCLACAMLGAVAVGDFRDLDDAVDNFIKIKKTIDPESKKVDLFKEKLEIYKKIYPKVKKFNHYLDRF